MPSLREDHHFIELLVFGGTGLLIILAAVFVFSLISIKRKLDIMETRGRSIEHNSEPKLELLKAELGELKQEIESLSKRIV